MKFQCGPRYPNVTCVIPWSPPSLPPARLVQADVGLDGGVDAEGGAAVLVVDDAQSVTEIAMTAINLSRGMAPRCGE